MSLEGNATGKTLVGSVNKCDLLTISAYGIAVKNGFEGTEAEWLASLKGDKGDTGVFTLDGEKSNIDMGGYKVTNLGAPTNTGDAVNLGYANQNYSGKKTGNGGEIFNYYTGEVVTGDGKVYPGNTANKGSHAEGFGTHADGEYAHAEGWNASATGGIAHAEGRETNATGYVSHAEGRETNATGSYAHAEGYKTEAIGGSSHAEGNETKATADFTHAEGQLTEASTMYAHAEGFKAKATGAIAHAQGRETEASGYASHTQNHTTKATGYASSAAGRGTIAAGKDQFVVGRFNQEIGDDALFIVGGGTSDADRKNVFRMDWDGEARFAGKVYSADVELAAAAKTASKKTLSVAAGGSVTVTLPDSGLFLVSFVDNARRGCVLLQTHQSGFYTESNTLLELGNWAFSTDGLNLTISETGGKWDGTACITALGRKNI